MIAALLVLLGQNPYDNAPLPSDSDLKTAVQVYRQLGMPLPAANAQIVVIPIGPNSNGLTEYRMAFRSPGTGQAEDTYLIGLTSIRSGSDVSRQFQFDKAVRVAPEQLKDYNISFWPGEPGHKFEPNAYLAFGMQLAHLGHIEVAKSYAAVEDGSSSGVTREATLIQRVYALKARDLFAAYCTKGTNAGAIAVQMRQILEHLPGKDQKYLPMELKIAESIVLANEPTGSLADSDERLVDMLVNFGLKEDGFYAFISADDPYMRAVLGRGKAIVPTIIAHMEDKRATRGRMPRRGNQWPYIQTVGQLCTRIIRSLTSWRSDLYDDPDAWWEEASKMSEEDFLKRAIFLHEGDLPGIRDRDEVSLSTIPLEMFALRFPDKIDELYLESLDRKKNRNYQLAKMVAESNLPTERKIQLFIAATERGTPSHKHDAVRNIMDFDPESKVDALKRLLAAVDPFGKSDRGDSLAWLVAWHVSESGDKEAIEMLFKKASELDSSVRLNVVDGLYRAELLRIRSGRAARLDALRDYLEDTSIHMTGRKHRDPEPIRGFNNAVSVRDFAAWCIGKLIDAPGEPQKGWRAEDWASYRGVVLDMLKKRDGGVILSHR